MRALTARVVVETPVLVLYTSNVSDSMVWVLEQKTIEKENFDTVHFERPHYLG